LDGATLTGHRKLALRATKAPLTKRLEAHDVYYQLRDFLNAYRLILDPVSRQDVYYQLRDFLNAYRLILDPVSRQEVQ